jgi:hypothetical protein
MKHGSLATVPEDFLGDTGFSSFYFAYPVPYPGKMKTWLLGRRNLLENQTLLLPYLEGGEVYSLEMLQGLTKRDELPRLVCTGPASWGIMEDT